MHGRQPAPRRRRRRSRAPLTIGILLALGLLVFRGYSGWQELNDPPNGEPEVGTAATEPELVRSERSLMGTRFEIQVFSAQPDVAAADVEAALDALEQLEGRISEWREDSEISRLNRVAGQEAVAVGPALFNIIRTAVEISERTNGAFDITFAACGEYWSFREQRVPADEELAECLPRVGYRQIELDPETREVFLPAGVRIGIAGIGKGYGVDFAAGFLESRGYRSYLVDGGGDIRVRGDEPERTWHLGIAHPRGGREGHASARSLEGSVALQTGALAGSGDYEQYFEQDGTRYHHILDPSTAMPARASAGVHVIAPTAMEADAYATAFFVLGGERAVAIADELPDVEIRVVDPALEPHTTEGFQQLWRVLDEAQ